MKSLLLGKLAVVGGRAKGLDSGVSRRPAAQGADGGWRLSGDVGIPRAIGQFERRPA